MSSKSQIFVGFFVGNILCDKRQEDIIIIYLKYWSSALLIVPDFAFFLCSDSPRRLLHNHEFAAPAEKLDVTKWRSLRTVVEWDHLLWFQSVSNVSSSFRYGVFSESYLSF
jgi:uncharacterized membrane protein